MKKLAECMSPLRSRRRRCLGSRALGPGRPPRAPYLQSYPTLFAWTSDMRVRLARRTCDYGPDLFSTAGGTMSNKIDLAGRFAAVTGGAQGIGRAIVERLLASECAVAIWDRDLSLARKTVNEDRKSTRLNSSHVAISYAVFCLKKKKNHDNAYLWTIQKTEMSI